MRSRWNVAACALLALACSSPSKPTQKLAPAGTPRDDGTGLLATLSFDPAAPLPDRSDDSADDAWDGDEPDFEDPLIDFGDADAGAPDPELGPYADYVFEEVAPYEPVPAPYDPRYVSGNSKATGTIRGTVHVPPRAEVAGCPSRPRRAVVYLPAIRAGRNLMGSINDSAYGRRLQRGGITVRDDCGFHPSVQVVAPLGAGLEMVSSGGDVTIERSRGAEAAVSTTALRGPGARASYRLDEAGWHAFRDAAGNTAWVMAAPHPYYVVADEDGSFRIDDVPVGSHTIAAWLEPDLGGQTPIAVSPRRVSIRAGKSSVVTLGSRAK